MITPSILNLVIEQGSDFNNLTFQLAHKCITRCAVTSSDLPSVIKIEPMGVTLPVGSILICGCDDLVLSAPMNPDDRVIEVTKIPSSIPNKTVIQGPYVDITGWLIRAKIRDKANSVIATFIGTISNALRGEFKVTIDNSITSTLVPNCTWQDYQNIDINTLGQPVETLGDVSKDYIKRFKNLCSVAYRWDMETEDTATIVTRRSEGLVLVADEVTK